MNIGYTLFGVLMTMDTKSKRYKTIKLGNPNQLPSSASDFYPIHRRSLNIYYDNISDINKMFDPLPESVLFNEYLLVSNFSRDDLSLIGHRPDIMNKLQNDDEKTLALYLYKVIQNDPLTTGVRENL